MFSSKLVPFPLLLLEWPSVRNRWHFERLHSDSTIHRRRHQLRTRASVDDRCCTRNNVGNHLIGSIWWCLGRILRHAFLVDKCNANKLLGHILQQDRANRTVLEIKKGIRSFDDFEIKSTVIRKKQNLLISCKGKMNKKKRPNEMR